jgi:hypothetical protein
LIVALSSSSSFIIWFVLSWSAIACWISSSRSFLAWIC